MKITYNEAEKIIEIDDDARSHYVLLRFSLVMNLVLVFLNLYDIKKTGIGFIDGIWIALGIISIVLFFIQIYKKSASSTIPIHSIKQLNEKLFFGNKWFSLQLKNGKKRDLGKLKTNADIAALKKLCSDIGILT